MQLLSPPRNAPPAAPRAELPTTVQLFSVPLATPPPSVAELPVSKQLVSVTGMGGTSNSFSAGGASVAPPPDCWAVLSISTQLFKWPPAAPPPAKAELPRSVQRSSSLTNDPPPLPAELVLSV